MLNRKARARICDATPEEAAAEAELLRAAHEQADREDAGFLARQLAEQALASAGAISLDAGDEVVEVRFEEGVLHARIKRGSR